MDVVLLGASGGKPSVELIVAADGERLPLPLDVDHGYAFDNGLARAGWVAVQVGYQVVALSDGNLLRTTRLPDAWRVLPAADPGLAVIDRYYGRSREDGDVAETVLVDGEGTTLKAVTTAARGGVGEARTSTLVTVDGLLGWDGALAPLPFAGEPVALLDGRHVVVTDEERVHLIDLETSARATCAWPADGHRLLLGPGYDARATAVAFTQWDQPDVFVATAADGPRWLQVGFNQRAGAWLEDGRLLLVGDREHCVLDVVSGEPTRLAKLPRSIYPRLAVGGRFDPEQLRSALRPPWTGPMSAGRRAELLATSEARIRTAAEQAGLPEPALEDTRPAVRLRSCLPPKRVGLGASRFCGRPDLPQGHAWPSVGGEPMAFMAQLRTDEIAAAWPAARLPEDGLLMVFAQLEPESGYPLSVHAEIVATTGLKRLAWPPKLPDEFRFDPALAVPEPVLAVPDWPTLEVRAPPATVRGFLELIATPGADHRLFGHPSRIQNDSAPDGYELLLQLDGDTLTGTSFSDGGRLHIWYPSDAALTGVIDGCVILLDCH